MRRTKYPIHPDFKKYENFNPPLNKVVLPVMQKLTGYLFKMEKPTEQVDVKRLIAAGVPVAINNNLGTIHGFDIAPQSKIVRECVNQRMTFIKKIFNKRGEI